MKKPRYTDTHRYPNGYKKAAETNVKETFNRVRLERTRNEAEQEDKVRELKREKK